MPCLGVLGLGILKKYCHAFNQRFQICPFAKFCEETKIFKFETKNALFVFYCARTFTIIVIFIISVLEFVYLENFAKKQNKTA